MAGGTWSAKRHGRVSRYALASIGGPKLAFVMPPKSPDQGFRIVIHLLD